MEKLKVVSFLEKYGMDFESINIDQCCKVFIEEMDNGLNGKPSSLKMIPAYVSPDKEVPVDEPVIVIDAGGTNFRTATVFFDKNKKPVIENFKIYPMPGIQGMITKDEFFNTAAQYIEPALEKSGKIGFCFSYSAEILPNRDGRVIQLSKEVHVEGIEGELLGENLLNSVKQLGYGEEKSIILINDTAATLLGGKASYSSRIFDSYIGFILGTGTNTCYMEYEENIRKMSAVSGEEGLMLINIESGGYERARRGVIDVGFDNETINPGQHVFEKMISGGYQGNLILFTIKKACTDGLFSSKFVENISCIKELSAKSTDDFLYYPYGDNILAACCSSTDDRITLYYLIDSIIERAAKLVTVNLASVIIKTGKGRNPCKPVCITAEGTTFYKSKLFRNKLDYYIKRYLNEEKCLYCEFVKVDNATLIGTAMAALTV